MSNLHFFLKELKLKSSKMEFYETGKLKIVIGNTACDLDSAACTLAVALHMTLNNSSSEELVLPVFNLSLEEMKIKTEVVFFLERMQIPLEDLIYRPDIENILNLAKQRTQLAVTLVDHHYDEDLIPCITEIFDHHIVHAEIPNWVAATIKPVGSCATIAMQLISSTPQLMVAMFKNYRNVIEMCYGAILLDTANLNPTANRYTQLDISMLELIEENLSLKSEGDLVRNRAYSELLAVRNDVSKLSVFQMLCKDYKMVRSMPVCSLTTLVQEFVGSVLGAQQALDEVCTKFNTREVVLVGMRIQDNIVTRDLGFYSRFDSPLLSPSSLTSHELAEHIFNCREPHFQMHLIRFPVNAFQGIQIFQQRNTQLTRKHLIPVILDAYS